MDSLAFVFALIVSGPAYAQRPAALAGVVVDETDAVLPRARVTVIDAAGRTIHTTQTGTDGKFAVDQVTPGTYAVVVELPPFVAATGSAVVPESGPAPFLRTVLRAGGFAEDVVVTGRRVETRIIETPQKVEIVDAALFLNEERAAQQLYGEMKGRYNRLGDRAKAVPEDRKPTVMTGRGTRGDFVIAGGRIPRTDPARATSNPQTMPHQNASSRPRQSPRRN